MRHFTIRDLLWLTTLAAVAVAWSLDHSKRRIDWQHVEATEQRLARAEKELLLAKSRTDAARHQQALIFRAAQQRGVTLLDLEPETKIHASLLPEE
jgi:hypothetical protein